MTESPVVAARRVDANTDRVGQLNEAALRKQACRAVLREAARRVSDISVGCTVDGVEEIEFQDRLEQALLDYIKARTDMSQGRAYIGVTAGMDRIANHASSLDSGTPANG